MKKTILITGVAGLLGSNLANWIIENKGGEYDVIGIDDLSGGYLENVHKDVIFYRQDLLTDVSEIFDKHQPEYVYHYAAYAAEGLSPFIRMFNYKSNLLTTANIINNCITHKVKRIVFTSSMAVYGNENKLPFVEIDTPKPIDPYGVAKFACEMDLRIAGEQHGLDWCVLRPHNVYGVNQNIWDKYRNVLGIWMFQYMNGNPLTIFGDGNQKRAFSYIKDVLHPMWNAATSEKASKQIINLGGKVDYTINEASDMLINVMDGGEKLYLEPRHEAKEAYCTYEKSVELLGYNEQYNLKDGLVEMWEWAKNAPQKRQIPWSKYEINDKLYEYWKK